MRKFIRKFRLKQSPFMLAGLSALLAIFLGFLWPLAELLKVFGICDIVFISQVLLVVLFPVSFFLLSYALHKYVKNGYIRKECADELVHKQSIRQSNKFKQVDNFNV